MSLPVTMKSDARACASAICGVGETWYDAEIGEWSKTAARPSEKENGRLRRPRDVYAVVMQFVLGFSLKTEQGLRPQARVYASTDP